eukprot:15844-Heterococcus_DN1.PRE.3
MTLLHKQSSMCLTSSSLLEIAVALAITGAAGAVPVVTVALSNSAYWSAPAAFTAAARAADLTLWRNALGDLCSGQCSSSRCDRRLICRSAVQSQQWQVTKLRAESDTPGVAIASSSSSAGHCHVANAD